MWFEEVFSHLWVNLILLHIPIIWYVFSILSEYAYTWKVFYNHEWKIPTFRILIRNAYYKSKYNTLKEFTYHPFTWMKRNFGTDKETWFIALWLISLIWFWAIYIISSILAIGQILIALYYIWFFLTSGLMFIIFWQIWRVFVEYFHPLYSFWNLWSKIQSLTPQIEEKSKEIQKNFQEDMNFSVLSDGFDALSKTFSEIISLVIKLEKIEAKANKGNLFDSEKYINSLRTDILKPLQQLKWFLEMQKEQLISSQGELRRVRVRIWSSKSLTQESELSSKRSDSLISELTENIEKLDDMVSKLHHSL